MTDWGASHSTVASALAGLDWEMPGAGMEGFAIYYGPSLKAAVEKGAVPKATLDNMVRHILTSMVRVGLFDRRNTPPPSR